MLLFFFFFFNDTATTEIYTLSLHDALPICHFASCTNILLSPWRCCRWLLLPMRPRNPPYPIPTPRRSEEHTSELQSQSNLVCRLLLEKKKQNNHRRDIMHEDSVHLTPTNAS